MEHKKIIKFTVSIVALTVLLMLMTLSNIISYPLNTYLMIAAGIIILLLTAKFIYDFFNTKQSVISVHNSSSYGKETFLISPYRTTTLSVVMILMPVFLIYIVVQLLPQMIEEIKADISFETIIVSVLSVILFFASAYCFFHGIKLFIRRNNIIQLVIDDDRLEFFPIYDFGTARRSTNALSMFFRKKMEKVYFTDQLTVEKINDKWQGDKIRMRVEGVSFYLPYLYNDANELEGVYQAIKQRLERKL
ncbi:hypothetical protein [Chryseobacterium vrystaatense]|nr:hypothetical protein [Chryseobacterium vrystaatense]